MAFLALQLPGLGPCFLGFPGSSGWSRDHCHLVLVAPHVFFLAAGNLRDGGGHGQEQKQVRAFTGRITHVHQPMVQIQS